MAVQKYKVNLSRAERDGLPKLIQNEAPRSRRVKHAKILLESDLGRSAAKIAYWVGVGHSTVERTRQRYAEGGVKAALHDKPRLGVAPKLDGKQAAFVVALACSDTPTGQEKSGQCRCWRTSWLNWVSSSSQYRMIQSGAC